MTGNKWADRSLVVIISFLVTMMVLDGLDLLTPKSKASPSTFAIIACDNFKPISITANTQVITAGGPNNFIYICSYNLNSSAAITVSIVEGTGTTCATNPLAVVGNSTATNGLSFAVNGTINYGGGTGAVAKTAVAGDNVCILTSAAGTVAGVVSSTQAPY